jgi:DNA-binding IclR family transcriptional regulator
VPARRHFERTTEDPVALGQGSTEAYYASRTLQALEQLTFNDLSCPQVAAALQIHPRTARRLLMRLAADGYIEQTFDSRRRYRATLRLAALGAQVVAHAELPRIAASHVADLHAATRAVAHLVIPSYGGAVCVVHGDRSCAGQPPRPMLRELLPAHATAAGKVLLAFRQPWRDNVLASPCLASPRRPSSRRGTSSARPRRSEHAATPSTTGSTGPRRSGWLRPSSCGARSRPRSPFRDRNPLVPGMSSTLWSSAWWRPPPG